jgi:integrase/recombinase XerC
VTAVSPEASRQAVVEAAPVLLERMGLTPADLAAVPQARTRVPTFAEYVPVVSAAVSTGTRRAYGSYWNRVVEHWGGRFSHVWRCRAGPVDRHPDHSVASSAG